MISVENGKKEFPIKKHEKQKAFDICKKYIILSMEKELLGSVTVFFDNGAITRVKTESYHS